MDYYDKYFKYNLNQNIVTNTNIQVDNNQDYLKNIIFINETNENITNKIKPIIQVELIRLFDNKNWNDLKKEIDTQINDLKEVSTMEKCDEKRTKWIECSNICHSTVKRLISIEISSTAYILRTLSESIISTNTKNKTMITIIMKISEKNISNINGAWSNDNKYFDLVSYGSEKSCTNCTNGRLIMGFGPSASGKTFWAKNIINLFNKVYKDFPTSFISIDGGIYRSTSYIYQITKELIKSKCFAGFSNLVLASFSAISTSMFDSNDVKNMLVKYIKNQINIKINLYVPDTLGGCDIIGKKCKNVYKKYISITKDKNWIGLLIWQHKNQSDCQFSEKYKCMGCTESGKEREIEEGKKYSNASWDRSMINGTKAFLKARNLGGSYKIHSTGGRKYMMNGVEHNCISIIEDFTIYSQEDIKKNIINEGNTYNYLYVRGKN